MRTKKENELRVIKRSVAACAIFICTAFAGYADQLGDFTYEEYNTYIEIIHYPEDATGDAIIPSEIVGKPVTTIGDSTFRDRINLTSITIPDSLISIGEYAFSNCTSLTSVMIPASVTSIGDHAFSGCISLTSVAIPDSISNIARYAFSECTSLANVTIGSAVTSIGEGAFSDCSSLTDVTIGSGVTSIEYWAFRRCSSLNAIYFEGDAPNLGSSVFEGTDNAIVYYLSGTTGWEATFGGRPTEEAPNGGIPVDGLEGWFYSGWFGFYAAPFDPWLFHADHGFIYRYPESTNASLYFYDDAMGAWWWTNETIYPYLYRFNDGVWLWYQEGSSDPRWFLNLGTGIWELR